MILSNLKSEQINENLEIVMDNGEILNKDELVNILLENFPNTEEKDGVLYGEKEGKKYCIYFKNISYLGTPHPFFKKRIQIGDNFKTVFKENTKQGIQTLLLGVYKYKSTLLFVDFDITKYATNKSHNSSAHVYTIDLKNGLLFGILQKEDVRKNLITVFTPENVERYLTSKIVGGVDLRLEFIAILDDFYSSLAKNWHGISCYQEMIDAGFNNAYQPEWPGFYHEFKLQEYLKNHPMITALQYKQNKKKGEIDLDLFFPQANTYGNDWETVMSVIENESIYYVVVNHDTERDRDHNSEVTEFWNRQLGKKDLQSYANKMKNSVKLTSYYILEINKENKQYLDEFKQGHNSDGNPRQKKIQIKKKNLDKFLIHQMEF